MNLTSLRHLANRIFTRRTLCELIAALVLVGSTQFLTANYYKYEAAFENVVNMKNALFERTQLRQTKALLNQELGRVNWEEDVGEASLPAQGAKAEQIFTELEDLPTWKRLLFDQFYFTGRIDVWEVYQSLGRRADVVEVTYLAEDLQKERSKAEAAPEPALPDNAPPAGSHDSPLPDQPDGGN